MTSVTIKIDLVTKPGEPLCSRTVEMPLKANMFGFHSIIQSLFQWQGILQHQFVSPNPFFVPGDMQSVVTRVGGEAGYPSTAVKVQDMLRKQGDSITYWYGDWRHTLTVTATGGRQRTRAKVLNMKGPSPVENARKAPGGWRAVWQALTKLQQARTMEGQHVIYNKMSKKERASVDFLGGVHRAHSLGAARKDPNLNAFQKRLSGIDVAPLSSKEKAEANHIDQTTSLHMPQTVRVDGFEVPTMMGSYGSPQSHEHSTDLLSCATIDLIVGDSRSAWDVVVGIVEELSPYPQVADILESALKDWEDSDLTAREIEALAEPLRECIRIIGSDEGTTTIDQLVRGRWEEFSDVIGHDFSDPESQRHCLTAYLKASVCFKLLDFQDQGGYLELTPLGRELLAESDFSMDEVERARTNRKLFNQVVSRIPFDTGPFGIYLAASMGMLLAHEEMQDLGDSLRTNPMEIYEETLHAIVIGLGIHNREGLGLINGYSDIFMHFMEFSGLIDTDLEEGTQKFNSAGQAFVALCLGGLNYGRVTEGLKDYLWKMPVLY